MIHYISNVMMILALAVNPAASGLNAAAPNHTQVPVLTDDWKTLSESSYSISYPATWQLDQSKASKVMNTFKVK